MMDTEYVVYICDLCFKEIKTEAGRAVWIIDDRKHDVCSECILRLTVGREEEEDAG